MVTTVYLFLAVLLPCAKSKGPHSELQFLIPHQLHHSLLEVIECCNDALGHQLPHSHNYVSMNWQRW